MNLFGRTEAMESFPSVGQALDNLAFQIRTGQGLGVIEMYEEAAFYAGASYDDIELTEYQARHA